MGRVALPRRRRVGRILASVLVGIAVVLSTTVVGAVPDVDWPMYRFDEGRTGNNKLEKVLSPTTVADLQLAWVFDTGLFADSSPAVVDGVAYFGSDAGYLYAVDAGTGTMLWSAPNGYFENSSPAVSDGVVYLAGAATLWARNAATGDLVWSASLARTPFSLTSPVVVDGVVYIGSNAGLRAFDAATGTELWMFATPAGVGSSPAIVNKVAYISTGATVYAVDLQTHAALWSYATGGASGAAQPSLAVDKNELYIGVGGALHSLDATTGALRWKVVNAGFVRSSPAVANNVVYVGSTDHDLYAFDTKTGAPLWSFATEDWIGFTSPAVANGVVYIGSLDGRIYAVHAQSGALLWSFATGGIVEGSPTVTNGALYIPSNDHYMYAFTLAGGGTPPPAPTGCQNVNGLYLPSQGLVPGICRFEYFTGATYSGEGRFTITCSGGGGPFTATGYDLPLTGCSGLVSVFSKNPALTPGGPGGGTVVIGNVPEEPGPCDAACLDRARQRVQAALAANPPAGQLPPPM